MILSLLLALQATPAPAGPAPDTALSPAEIVAAAPAGDWVTVPDDQLLVMTLAGERRVLIQLADGFAPTHLANIRALARARWWDGTSVNRVQDNYVAQWGDATEAKPLPDGLRAVPETEYERPVDGLSIRPIDVRDAYASAVGISHGWPVAGDGRSAWLPHCYAMVGVGRNLSPETGTGAELYTVIGHAPRHLDRNIAVVGRVIEGIEHLSSLPRGTGALGFYERAEARVPIVSIRLAAELPASERPRIHYLGEASTSFGRYADARMNRRDPFFNRPAGGADICNIAVPIRRAPGSAPAG